jgi:predicted O-methyltransferase YrrM
MTNKTMNILKKIGFRIKNLETRLILSKIKDYQDIEGFLSPFEAAQLYRIASFLPPESTIVEIGSWKGKSTYCLAKGIKKGKVIAIDPFDSSGDEASSLVYQQLKGEKSLLEQFTQKMEQLKVIEKIETYQGLSQDFVNKVKKIDFLFIDGDHSIDGCNYDFTNYSTAISSGGYLAIHDYYPSRKDLGPTWVIENKILPSQEYELIGVVDSLWFGKKK